MSKTRVAVDTFNTSNFSEDEIVSAIKKVFPLTPKGIIEHLDLKRPIYKKTSCYGHFGRLDPDFTWEKLDKVDELKRILK